MKIRVPGTTANLGPGFDSCGLALNLYLTLDIGVEQKEWHIEHTLGAGIPTDETNIIIQTALSLVPELKPRKMIMECSIPTARGLGSSSAALVTGIELANQLGDLKLSQTEKVRIATSFEGHPDNVAPAIMGDFVVATQLEEELFAVKHVFPKTGILVVIPSQELLTEESRSVLPATITHQEAVRASAIANVMIAAILNDDLSLAGKMMEEDRWHEKYRKEFVPHLPVIRRLAHENGAQATYLSGAGPTVLVLVPLDKLKRLQQILQEQIEGAEVKQFEVEREGVQVYNSLLQR